MYNNSKYTETDISELKGKTIKNVTIDEDIEIKFECEDGCIFYMFGYHSENTGLYKEQKIFR